ncbi:MAG: hypothetical protein AB1468_00520 [Candidatus Micrarchaeota archaeon]
MENMKLSGSRKSGVVLGVGVLVEAVAMIINLASIAKGEDKVGTYPNFTGYGVHGNPAALHSSQLGQWGYLEVGRSGDGTKNTDAMVSADIGKGVTGSVCVSNSVNKDASSSATVLNLSERVAEKILLGAKLAKVSASDGSETDKFSFGGVGVFGGDRRLVRLGAMQNSSNETQFAVEDREKLQIFKKAIEATISGKITLENGKVKDKGVGFQLKKGKNVVSFGKGNDTKFHLRRIFGKEGNTLVDLHVVRKPERKQNYFGIGVTRCF